MDPQKPVPNDLSFQTMPQQGNLSPKDEVPLAAPMPIRSGAKLPPSPQPSLNDFIEPEPEPSFFRSKLVYIIIGIIVLAILGVGAWYLLGSNKTTTQTTQTQELPKTFLSQEFGVDDCSDTANCGYNSDPDTDGLSNYDEFVSGTTPTNPDTDSDGLSDGDEVHIYKTDPNLKYTDRRDIVQQNDWTDSLQIKNGFDPLTPGLKFTDARNQQITEDIGKYGLHEPTSTSLKAVSANDTSTWKTYTNSQYGFEFRYPSIGATEGTTLQSYLIEISINQAKGGVVSVSLTDNKISAGTIDHKYFGKMTSPTNLQVGGKTAYQYKIDQSGCRGYLTAVSLENKTLEISLDDCYAGGATDSGFPDSQFGFYNQILASFKFTK